jgi:type I restriction enzyme S subunit
MNHGLKPAHFEAILDILRKHPRVEKAVLFGSRAMGTFTKESDIDLCLIGDALTLDDQADLLAAFEKLPMAQVVDLVLEKKIEAPAFLEHIRKEGKTVFERERGWRRRSGRTCGGLGMGGERAIATIADVLADGGSIKTGPFKTTLKASEYSSVGVPLISVGEIGYGTIRIHEKTPRVSPAVTTRLAEYVLQEGDIVFGRKGAVDRSARISAEQRGWFLGSDGIRLRLPETTDSRFMAFQLQSPASRNWILQHATGTTMASLNQDVIGRIPISLPPLGEQRAIARILGALDDKIELNRKTNATLEAMARALFKSWFVDFDPVRAKAEGRAPSGMDAETAKLFPSEFVDSELGPIPKGWRVGSIYELSAVEYGAPYASSKFNTEKRGLPVVGIRDLADQTPAIWTDEEHPRAVRLADGDVVVGMDGEFRAHVWGSGAALLNQRACRFSPRDPKNNTFVRLSLGPCLEFVERTEVATTVIHLGKSDIDQFRVVLPSRALLNAFAVVAGSFVEKQIVTRHDSKNLARIRDALLPRLLSGELPVDAAERAVEEVA